MLKRGKTIGLIVHCIFWLSYGILLYYVPSVFMETKDALILSLSSLLLSATIFYFNAYYLMARYLNKGAYWKYLSGIAILIIFSVSIYSFIGTQINEKYWKIQRVKEFNEHIENESILHLKKEEIILFHHPDRPPRPKGLLRGMHTRMGVMTSIIMLFISTLFGIYMDSRGRNQRELALVNQNLINEMKFLKSQMNPHFLFNALNNIYSLSILHSVKTPEMVLKLSAMLRYVLYESEDVKVDLGKEVDYIKNFIEFQRIKIEGIPNLHVDIDRADKMIMIEPMLLIPFVENSFKHSKIEDTENGWIKMTLTSSEKSLEFEIKNSRPKKSTVTSKDSGIGIENVKRRLNYLYPNKHVIGIFREDEEYCTQLKIFLK